MGQLIYGGAAYKVQKAKVKAARITQAAHNQREGAESALANFSAALNNRRRMDAAGAQIETIQRAIAKNTDAKVAGDLNGQIAVAEELGANTTMAAAAGVGGSSIEAYNRTVQLRANMGKEEQDRAFSSDVWNAQQDIQNTEINAVSGLDNNVYRANLDYTHYVNPKKQGWFASLLEVGATAAATYFGGPQAGQAVMSMFDARQAARNGDYATASASFNGALKSAYSGFQDFRTTGGNGYFNTAPTSMPTPQLPARVPVDLPTYQPASFMSGGFGGYSFGGM
jgi:hypothetical protein